MSKVRLDRASLRLLMTALEASSAALSPAAMQLYSDEVERLKKAGLIKPIGAERTTTARGDFSDEPVNLTWSPEHEGYGYFCQSAGWVHVPKDELQAYGVNIEILTGMLTRRLGLKSKEATELLPGHLWELGGAYLPKRPRRTTIMFGRRLSDPKIWREILAVLVDRPSLQRRLLLTSTSTSLITQEDNPCDLVPLEPLIEANGSMEIEPDLLGAYLRHGTVTVSEQPLVVRADGREVHFYGEVYHFPKGEKQRRAICFLYQKYLKGEYSVSSAVIAEEVELGRGNRIRDLFKKNSAWGRLLTERDGMCGFCFRDESSPPRGR